jgi:hypothetical protein
MAKKCLVIMILFGLAPALFSGITGKINGHVTDAKTGDPLAGANVIIEGTNLGAATDLEGDYFIINIPPGNYTVSVSMMGYTTVNQTDVKLSVDHTATADFSLEPAVLEGKEVTVIAERDVIKMDMSASLVSLEAADVTEVPNATSIQEVISLQVGVDVDPTVRGQLTVRGSGRGENAFMVDGLMMVDNRNNRPMMMVNLSSVKEINIIKGGFNAEYGNVRSGLINVVTKEGSRNQYNGSFDGRLTPAHLKHRGYSVFDPNNYFLRPFLDEEVCWDGTSNWDEETKARYPSFIGWNRLYRTLLRKYPGVTAEDARELFIWQHRAQGVEDLTFDSLGVNTRQPGEYGHLPDYNVDVSFGGPIPVISKKLGNLRFFANHRINKEMFALPTNRDYFSEQNSQLKISTDITPSLKLMVEGIYGEIKTLSSDPRGSGMDAYMLSGMDILYSAIAQSDDYGLGGNTALYYPAALNKFDIYRSMGGLAVDHVLSPSTFYNMRLSYTRVKNLCPGPTGDEFRSPDILGYLGAIPVTETPLGYQVGIEVMTGDNMSLAGEGAARDWSEVNTVNFRFDMTSQVNKYNEVKAGIEVNYDDLDVHYEHNQIGDEGNNWQVQWRRFPYRGGMYVQDKLEFKGMIANLGLRAEFSDPNSKAFVVDRYSQYFRRRFMDTFQDLAPYEDAKARLKLAPRLGISHPISDKAKLYFNYGHFYSVPTANELFIIMKRSRGLSDIGNPDADFAKTVAYELGVEYSLSDMFLIHLSGYYKDITDQLANIHYVGIDGGVDYWSQENNNYEDIRGFELRVEKRFGRWVTGWANYNYLVTTSGYVGRQTYYEDSRRMAQEGLMNPYQERPLARPVARANLTLSTPGDFGPVFAGFWPLGGFRMDVLYSWRAGRYESEASYAFWNPIGDVQQIEPLQWRGRTSLDLRFRKNITVKQFALNLYLDVSNVLDLKFLEDAGFSDTDDYVNYMKSLHLPRYNGDEVATKEEYEAMGLIGGHDKPGDIKSKDKPWVDMPNREFLTFFNPRTITFGIGFNF